MKSRPCPEGAPICLVDAGGATANISVERPRPDLCIGSKLVLESVDIEVQALKVTELLRSEHKHTCRTNKLINALRRCY